MNGARFKEGARNFGFWLSRKIGYTLVGPEVIQIPLTNRCNLQCKMCSIKHSQEDRELTASEIKQILLQAKDMGVKEAILTGGEPFLKDHIFEIGLFCKDNDIRSVVTTNGTRIDTVMAEKIASCGLSHIHFSIDGLKEAHDFFRGSGNFGKAIDAIIRLNGLKSSGRPGPSLGVACTVMENNIGDLYNLTRLLDGLKVDVINFQPFVKDNTDMQEKGKSPWWVSHNSLSHLREELVKIKSHRFEHIRVYEQPALLLLNKYYSGKVNFFCWKCFSGYKTIFISTSNADKCIAVYTCGGICGNLEKNGLKDIWFSPSAKRARSSARKCKKPCLQACYSKTEAESLGGIFLSLARAAHDN